MHTCIVCFLVRVSVQTALLIINNLFEFCFFFHFREGLIAKHFASVLCRFYVSRCEMFGPPNLSNFVLSHLFINKSRARLAITFAKVKRSELF